MEKVQNIVREEEYRGWIANGFVALFLILIGIPVVGFLITYVGFSLGFSYLVAAVVIDCIMAISFLISLAGFFTQEPNEARALIFFGKYKGTFRRVGFFWINPFLSRVKLSLRIRNMDIEPIKVNDKIGNPVLIGMVLVWRINDTYKVVFDLDSQSLGANTSRINNNALDRFVRIQSDAALREVTGQFAYDESDSSADELTLRDGGETINDLLEKKINERLAMAGMEVVEARLNYLAYAPEIAAVMLRRQQASAIISAREKIVEGAVSMVDMALKKIENEGVVKLSEDRKAAMVSNLLVVLCADEAAQPVLNTGNDQ